MLSDPTTKYARKVIAGKEIAGPFVRLACQRHLDDIKFGPKRGLKWDLKAAHWAMGFFSDVLRLAGGEHEGKPFKLHESQEFIIGSLFGWKTKDGFRRFRVAYIEEAKGNGKSPLAAGIGLYMLAADEEARAEVYAAAVDKDQAKILFRDAVAMVDQSPELTERIQRSGGRGREWNLAYLETGSFFRPISSEHVGGRGKSGPRPHCVLLDEVHEHPSDSMVSFMRAGTKGRTQALILLITNAGIYDTTSVCFQYHDYSEKVLRGTFSDDAFFSYVCALDEKDDWKDPKVWKKTNPLLGVSVTEKYLEEQVREAVGMPSKQSLIRRLNFCEWVESGSPFVDPELWKANAGTVPDSMLSGVPCYGGLDLSGKNDLTALVLVFVLPDGTKAARCYFWAPMEGAKERGQKDHAPYEQWAREGHLALKPGATVDYGWVAYKLGDLQKEYNLVSVAFDRWRIDDMNRELDDAGINVELIPHGQGFQDMNPALEALEDDLKEHRLRHGNNPILSWCLANTRVVSDPAGGRKFDKRKATGRIDGAVALAMASNLAASTVSSEPQFFVLGG